MKFFAIVLFSMMLGVCFAEDCPCTKEYRPVCASNGVTYANRCLFECAKRSDAELYILYEGVCKEERSFVRPKECICPDVIDPVCTSIGTFQNSCQVSCYNRDNPNKRIAIECRGECPCIYS